MVLDLLPPSGTPHCRDTLESTNTIEIHLYVVSNTEIDELLLHWFFLHVEFEFRDTDFKINSCEFNKHRYMYIRVFLDSSGLL